MERHISAILIVAFLGAGTSAQDRVWCTREGIQCSDCSTVTVCVKDSDGMGLHEEPYRKCPEGIVCDQDRLYCSRYGKCRYKKFQCPPNNFTEEVTFPDPYSCNIYHGCLGNDEYAYECDPGTAFDPAARNCSLKLNDRSCRDYRYLCEYDGQRIYIDRTNLEVKCLEEYGPPNILYPIITIRDPNETTEMYIPTITPTVTRR